MSNVNHDRTDSEPEETPDSSSSDPEEPVNRRDVSEYEKQRLSRIAENKKRIEALGLAKLATSFIDSAKNSRKIHSKGKRKLGDVNDADEDYEPAEDSPSAEDEDEIYDSEEGDEDFASGKVSEFRGMKIHLRIFDGDVNECIWRINFPKTVEGKNKGSKAEKKTFAVKSSNSDYGDDDDALRQAIELSLRDSGDFPDVQVQGASHSVRRKNVKTQEATGGTKRKGSFTSRTQMNEDELIMNFYYFDESWNGCISVGDIRRVAAAHDFIWSDKELKDMIDCFDSDGDGKLSLEDFRRIVGRCNMIKGSLAS